MKQANVQLILFFA